MILSFSLSERPASATIYILGAFLSPLPAVGRSLYRHYVITRLRILIPVSATDLEASRGRLITITLILFSWLTVSFLKITVLIDDDKHLIC